MKSVACAVALSSLVLASPASAEIIDEMPSNEGDHDSGFMFRGTLGFGYESLSIDAGFDATIGGVGGSISVALGGFVIPNLAINADLYALAVVDPSVEFNGQDLGEADAKLGLTAIGVGLTYYIMPLNLYLAGSVGIGQGSIEIEGGEAQADAGLAIHLSIGKEWFVSPDWGLGIAAEFVWADVPPDDDTGDSSASFTGFNVAFSVTYN